MKKLTYEEFSKRVNEVNKAYKIFSPLTNNMTDCFRIYLEVLAEEQMPLFISTEEMGNRPMTEFDDYERPKCPNCDSDLMFRPVPKNDEGINTQLVCSNNDCDTVLDSQLTLEEWKEVLVKK